MKTTLDLPEDLIRRLKLRALRDGRKLKDAVADVLHAGLAAKRNQPAEAPAVVAKDKKSGLPVIQCRRAAPRGKELTPQRVAGILAEQESGWASESA